MYFIQFEKHQLHTILRVKDHYLQNGHELFVDSALNIFLVATNAQDYNVNQTKISTISKKKREQTFDSIIRIQVISVQIKSCNNLKREPTPDTSQHPSWLKLAN